MNNNLEERNISLEPFDIEKKRIEITNIKEWAIESNENILNNFKGIDFSEVEFSNTHVTEEGIKGYILSKIISLSGDGDRKNFKGVSEHDIHHIIFFGSRLFERIKKKIKNDKIKIDFIDLSELNFYESSLNILRKSFNKVYYEFLDRIIYFSRIFDDENEFKELYSTLGTYNYMKDKYSLDEIAEIFTLTGNEGKVLHDKINFLINHEKVEDIFELYNFLEFNSKYFNDSLNFINNRLIDSFKILESFVNEKNIDDYIFIKSNLGLISRINNDIRALFASNVGKFNLPIFFENLGFIYGNIDININLEDKENIFIKNNLFGVFSNIILNVSEHAFGKDFIGLDKNLEIYGTFLDNGDYIIGFKDNGRGITEKELEKMFIDGETIKEEKKGHGIAMAGYKKEMQNLGGDLLVDSEGFGKGALFKVIIPSKIIESNK